MNRIRAIKIKNLIKKLIESINKIEKDSVLYIYEWEVRTANTDWEREIVCWLNEKWLEYLKELFSRNFSQPDL